MQRRPPKRGPCRTGPPWQVGVLLNALVVLSLVLGPVSAAAAPGPGGPGTAQVAQQ